MKSLAQGIIQAALALFITCTFTYFFGVGTLLVSGFAIGIIGTTSTVLKKRSNQKQIAKVSENDDRSIRFQGSQKYVQKAAAIAYEHGWSVEWVENPEPYDAQIRLMQGESALSSKALIQSFFEADIACSVAA